MQSYTHYKTHNANTQSHVLTQNLLLNLRRTVSSQAHKNKQTIYAYNGMKEMQMKQINEKF